MWLGADTFDTAPASIDFEGNALFSSVTIKNKNGAVLIDSNSSTNDFINIINNALDTSEKKILGNFSFGPSGAITIQTDANNGLWLSPNGILAKKAGVTTFSVESDGDVSLKGTLLAGSVVACDISGVNITSSSGNNRIRLSSGDLLEFYYSNVRQGYIRADASGDLHLYGTDDIIFHAGGADRCGVFSNSFRPINSDYTLGTSSNKWGDIYTGSTVFCNRINFGSWKVEENGGSLNWYTSSSSSDWLIQFESDGDIEIKGNYTN